MQVKVIQPFRRGGELQAVNSLIEIPAAMLPKMAGLVTMPDDYDAKKLPAYCSVGDAWCSSKLRLSPCQQCEISEKQHIKPERGQK